MYTNSDICLTSDIYEKIKNSCDKWNCTFSFRKDFRFKLERKMTKSEIRDAEWYVGSDLFAFTKKWWTQWRDYFPDGQSIGRPTWDWIFRIVMGKSVEGDVVFNQPLEKQGAICETPDISYHEKHDSYWERSENLMIDSNMINNRIAYKWMMEKSPSGKFTGKEYFERTYKDKL